MNAARHEEEADKEVRALEEHHLVRLDVERGVRV